jgi:hypothetical protein
MYPGIAMVLGSLASGRFSDWQRAKQLKAPLDGEVHPENRLADQIWGILLCSAGVLVYGWFCEFNIHPAAVLIAAFLGTLISLTKSSTCSIDTNSLS